MCPAQKKGEEYTVTPRVLPVPQPCLAGVQEPSQAAGQGCAQCINNWLKPARPAGPVEVVSGDTGTVAYSHFAGNGGLPLQHPSPMPAVDSSTDPGLGVEMIALLADGLLPFRYGCFIWTCTWVTKIKFVISSLDSIA